jgi:ribose 5-phosphate isomerase A
MPVDELKRRAALQAMTFVEPGMVVGLGTGTTASFAIRALAERLQSGELHDIVGIPTSIKTRELASSLRIPLATLDERPRVDVTIDGADEVDPAGNLIKGGGGALLWEKIVATASERLVIVVDDSKLVERLGTRSPLPVEVLRFGWRLHLDTIGGLGAEPMLKCGDDGAPLITDSGHYLLQCRFAAGIEDAEFVHRTLRSRPGIVETGLFLGMAPEVVVARAES